MERKILKGPVKKFAEGTMLAAIALAGAGCGDTTVIGGPTPTPGPKPTSTPIGNINIGPTATPASLLPAGETSFTLNPKDCVELQPNPTTDFVVSGDVKLNGRRLYDNLEKTGMETTVEGTQPVTVCADFGAHVDAIDPAALTQMQNSVLREMGSSGCVNGCSEGVQTFVYKDGQIINTGVRR